MGDLSVNDSMLFLREAIDRISQRALQLAVTMEGKACRKYCEQEQLRCKVSSGML